VLAFQDVADACAGSTTTSCEPECAAALKVVRNANLHDAEHILMLMQMLGYRLVRCAAFLPAKLQCSAMASLRYALL
jgi:hypothetical protein